MNEEAATATYCVAQPFDTAVKALRQALAQSGLKVTMELNVADRIRGRLLIGISPCLILFCSPAGPTAEIAGGLAPLHVVVSARGAESEIHILRVPRKTEDRETPSLALLGRLQWEIVQAVERIGMRVPLGA